VGRASGIVMSKQETSRRSTIVLIAVAIIFECLLVYTLYEVFYTNTEDISHYMMYMFGIVGFLADNGTKPSRYIREKHRRHARMKLKIASTGSGAITVSAVDPTTSSSSLSNSNENARSSNRESTLMTMSTWFFFGVCVEGLLAVAAICIYIERCYVEDAENYWEYLFPYITLLLPNTQQLSKIWEEVHNTVHEISESSQTHRHKHYRIG
jgi:hypothetical protein